MKGRKARLAVLTLLSVLGLVAGVGLAAPAHAVEQRFAFYNSYGETHFSVDLRAGVVRVSGFLRDRSEDWPWQIYAYATPVQDEVATGHEEWSNEYDGETKEFSAGFPSDSTDYVWVGMCGFYWTVGPPPIGRYREADECEGIKVYPA
jgi:hypothetical protein